MSIIYFSETNNRKDFVKKIVKIHQTHIDHANTIFVKPNIVSSESYPTTTNPQTLDSLLENLSGKKVVIGDGHAVDTDIPKTSSQIHP